MSRASRAVVLVVCLLAGLLATAEPALAAISVDPGAPDGVVDTRCSLREAVEAADGDPVADCAGGPSGEINIQPAGLVAVDTSLGPIVIDSDVSVSGVGMGVTTLVGDGVFPEPVIGVDPSATAALSGLTITGGTGPVGGGILSFGDLTMTGVELVGNDSVYGGGLAALSGQIEIVDSSIRDNMADDGGGIFLDGVVATISGTTITDNNAIFEGGGISACGCAGVILTIEDSEVTNNTAEDGGGIAAGPVDLTIEDSTFDANAASGNGGGLFLLDEGSVGISGSTFSANTADLDGGGIHAQEDGFGPLSVDLVNSTLSGNTASGSGGGISTQEPMTLTHTTVTGNDVGGFGGGVYVDGAVVTARNSLIGHQAAGDDCDAFLDDDGGNLDSDGNCFAGSPGGALNLGSLSNNGGPTDTHGLLSGSPAIDAGIGTWCMSLDQRGVTRPQGGGCDAGAYEFVSAPPPPPVRHDLEVEVIGEGRVTGTPSLGIDCGSTCSAKLTEGTSGRLIATPKPGHTFDGWTGDCATTDGDECTVSLVGDLSVVANFVPEGSDAIDKGRCKGMTMGTIDILEDGTIMRGGTQGDDVLNGSNGPDVICGLAGDDVVKGKKGSDVLLGGPGDDRIIGGKGDDRLNGGLGTDECRGGKGKNDLINCE